MSGPSVPLCKPSIRPHEIEAVSEVLASGWLAHGEYNHKFEALFAETIGVPHAISMNSCTSALEVALEVAGIRGEVICPSFTWVATANAIANVGATPVFCEVDPETRNATAATIEACLTERTEAVMPVHYGGQPCDMEAIRALCARKGLFLLEDSAETIGATWNGRLAGSFGVGAFSFFPTKNITTGEGGMLTCSDDEYAARVRARIAHGVTSTTLAREKEARPWLRAAEAPGHNFRMPNPLAALGWTQLQRLEEMNSARVARAAAYNEAFADLAPRLSTPHVAAQATHVYQLYTVRMEEALRDQVVNALRADKVGASVHFDPPVHLQPAYSGTGGALPATERLCREIVTLPMYPDMTDAEQAHVIESLRRAMG